MSLTKNIIIRPGTPKQQGVGIMARASVELVINGTPFIRLSGIEVRKTKENKWWVKPPAEVDRAGKTNEQGYVKEYPYFSMYPGETNKAKRDEFSNEIIEAAKKQLGEAASTVTTTTKAPTTSQANPAPARPQAPKSTPPVDDYNWEV